MTGTKNARQGGTDYSILRVATNEHYAEKVREGYQWLTNTPDDKVQRNVRKLSEAGLEFFVGDVAFSTDGKKNGLRVILIKGNLAEASKAISSSQEE